MLFFGRIMAVLTLLYSSSFAQNNKECVAEVLKIEEQNTYNKAVQNPSAVFYMNYMVSTTDWDNQTVNSNVKICKQNEFVHFFSEQGQIYQDGKESYCVLPIQRVVIMSTMDENLKNFTVGDNFYEFRKTFFDSCQVVRCEVVSQKPLTKILELKVLKDFEGMINIERIIYKYDVQSSKLLSVTTYYNKKYKVKKIDITINEINNNYTYTFNKARRYVLDKNGKILPKYNGYEIVDNREKKKKK